MKTHFPAGIGEKMQYLVHEFNDNTIRFVLVYPFRFQKDALKQAAYSIAASIDVLHASFVPGWFGAGWRVNEITPDDCFAFVHVKGDPIEEALSIALLPIAPSAPAMIHCLLAEGTNESAVVFRISHLCADGSDGQYLLHKLCEAYNLAIQTGDCRQLKIKNGSRAAEQAYSHLRWNDLRCILRDPRTGINSSFSYPTAEAGEPAVLRRKITADTMAAARRKLKKLNATVNDLLLASCYHSYVKISSVDHHTPVSIMSMMDLRRHCPGGDSPGLCNLTGSLPTALPAGISDTLEQTLAAISPQTSRLKSDPFAGLYGMPLLHGTVKLLPMKFLLSVAGHLYGTMSVGVTNIGSIDCQTLRIDGIAPIEGWFGGPVKKKPGVQISAVSFDGACSLSIWGNATEADIAVLQQFLDNIGNLIELFSDMPN